MNKSSSGTLTSSGNLSAKYELNVLKPIENKSGNTWKFENVTNLEDYTLDFSFNSSLGNGKASKNSYVIISIANPKFGKLPMVISKVGSDINKFSQTYRVTNLNGQTIVKIEAVSAKGDPSIFINPKTFLLITPNVPNKVPIKRPEPLNKPTPIPLKEPSKVVASTPIPVNKISSRSSSHKWIWIVLALLLILGAFYYIKTKRSPVVQFGRRRLFGRRR
jgi:hypothetical protein